MDAEKENRGTFFHSHQHPPLEVNEKKCYLSGKLIMDGGMKTSGQGRKIYYSLVDVAVSKDILQRR